MVADTARLTKTEQRTPAEWVEKKDAKKIIIMKGYELDPNKERNTCYTGGQATWQGQTQTQTQKHQYRMATTCTE